MENLPFFVYGTLRPGEGNYSYLLEGRTLTEETATLDGAKMFDYSGSFPFVVASDNVDDVVVGTLISVSDADFPTILLSLDRLEGYSESRPEDGMYRREVKTMTTENGQSVPAYVYICGHRMQAQVEEYPRVTSGDWFARPAVSFANRFTD